MLKNIAIIGTSPIMLILAKELSKKNKVTIFEKNKKIGGAWSLTKYKKFFFADKTNLIVPNMIKDTKHIKSMNEYLIKKLKLPIKNSKGKIFLSKTAEYQPKFFYEYNINKLLKKNFLGKITIKKKEIKSIYISDNNKVKVLSNEFDNVFIPIYSSIKKIRIKKKIYKSDFNKITSKHFFLIAKKIKENKFLYKEDFNEIFDRAQIIKKNKLNAFTGRIKKEYKKMNKKYLLKKLDLDYERHLHSQIIFYTSYFRNDMQKKRLVNICNKSKLINLIDTSNFVTGYSYIKRYLDE